MQGDDLAIRIRVLDGTWEVFGSDRARGVWPENFTASSNDWGNDKASFDLRRAPDATWPDLQAFNDVEVEIGGLLVWTGRLIETPARDGADPVINVQCEGWQYHLDDDVYSKCYAHTRLADWKDLRGFPANSVTTYAPRLKQEAEPGAITIGAVNGTAWAAASGAGVLLDLGPYNLAKRVVVTISKRQGGSANTSFYIRAGTTTDPINGGVVSDGTLGATVITAISTTGATYATTYTTPYRYVAVFLYNGTGYTAGGDDVVVVSAIQVFTDTAYESANASILKASQVVADARTQATSLLSTDVSKITTTSFSIPDFSFADQLRSPREVIQAVNAFHNYRTQVDVEKRLVFGARPSTPLFEVGTWEGSTFEDSSMNSGKDVYNRVIVEGTGPDGSPISATRLSGNAATTTFARIEFSGGAYVAPAAVGSASNTASPPFLAGLYYAIRVSLSTNSSGQVFTAKIGDVAAGDFVTVTGLIATVSNAIVAFWKPTANRSIFGADLTLDTGTITGYSFGAYAYKGTTVLDRRNFVRTKVLPVSAGLTTAAANQIGDVYLAAHRYQPLRGQVAVQPGGVREVLTGADVHPARLLREPAQLLRLSHRIDPDTGALGRDGTIAGVSYDHDSRSASISLDSERRNFEALLSRLSLLSK